MCFITDYALSLQEDMIARIEQAAEWSLASGNDLLRRVAPYHHRTWCYTDLTQLPATMPEIQDQMLRLPVLRHL